MVTPSAGFINILVESFSFILNIEKTFGYQMLSKKLIEYVLEYANENNVKIIPLCSNIKNYIQGHSDEYRCVGKVFVAGK